MRIPPPEPIREVRVIGPGGIVGTGVLMQHFHIVDGGMYGPDEIVKSECLRLKLKGLPDGEQDRRNPDLFTVPGAGEFLIQN